MCKYVSGKLHSLTGYICMRIAAAVEENVCERYSSADGMKKDSFSPLSVDMLSHTVQKKQKVS